MSAGKNPTAPNLRDALKIAGIHGDGRPTRGQGAVINFSIGPQNRAQRRLLARIKRRRKLP